MSKYQAKHINLSTGVPRIFFNGGVHRRCIRIFPKGARVRESGGRKWGLREKPLGDLNDEVSHAEAEEKYEISV